MLFALATVTGESRAQTGTGGLPTPPADARYAASRAGTTYYWIGCDAWKRLSPRNLIFFRSAAQADSAGYTPSRSRGCGRRPDDAVPPQARGADHGVAEQGADSTASEPGAVVAGVATLEADGAATAIPAPAGLPVCAIARVIDGDTVECDGGERVRLLLIDAPETGQAPYGPLARLALEALLPIGTAARIELDIQERDRYGRILAYLYLPDGRMANEELARLGYAVVSVYPPNVKHVERIRAAAVAAREGRQGLWATPAFECRPADHRAGRCDA